MIKVGIRDLGGVNTWETAQEVAPRIQIIGGYVNVDGDLGGDLAGDLCEDLGGDLCEDLGGD